MEWLSTRENLGILRPSKSRIEHLGAWFDTEYPRLLRFAYFLSADSQDAEDMVQEAFVRIYRAEGRVSDPEFPGYARRVLLNLSRSSFRRRNRERAALSRIPPPANEPDPADGVERSDMRRALIALSSVQRACLAMRFYEDRKEQEIADALGMTLSAVKKQIERGLKSLRPLLTDRSQQ